MAKKITSHPRNRGARQVVVVIKAAAFLTIPLLSLVLVIPAQAIPTSLDWGSFNASGSIQYGVYEEDGNTVLESGDLVQLVWVGPNGQVEPPYSNGMPGGDDQLLDSNRVNNDQPLPPSLWNKGYVPLKTYSFDTGAPYSGGTVYLRAWNAGSAAQATGYGDSETGILSSGSVFNAPSWQVSNEPTAIKLNSIEAHSRPASTGLAMLLTGTLVVTTAFLIIKNRRLIFSKKSES